MPPILNLIWNSWNIDHIARHEVTPEEVEEVCFGDHVFQDGKSGRLLVFGPTRKERMLTVVLALTATAGVYHVVTARPASRPERRVYAAEKSGGETP